MLDVGAGTGFVSLLAAKQGYRVTALDLAPGMLARLSRKAERQGLSIETVEANAAEPPADDFDAVVERHLLWTLPDPRAALEAWRRAAPDGRLVLLESIWGSAAGPEERVVPARVLLRQLRNEGSDHHAEYDAELRVELPLGTGTTRAACGPRPVDRLGYRPGREAAGCGVGEPGIVDVGGGQACGSGASFCGDRGVERP